MLKTYYLDSNKLSKQIRGIILLYGITGVIALIAIFITQRMSDNPNTPWLAITVIPVLIAFVASRSIHQRKELWEHYSLTLEEASLVQSQPNSPDTKIALASVTGIEETKDGLYLSSNQGNRVFGIPRQLRDEDYEELRLMLRNLVEKKDQDPPSFK
ncbi:MAG: hypothetical protein RBS09_07360 [Anaerolineaceae bacterium]|jgi:hypothetical protein|nr:hypothetical protein [Anaerolineaceae bacterium]